MIQGRSRLAVLPVSLLILLFSVSFALAQTYNAPESPPDASAGRDAFNDNCASCHGQLAMGDGRAVSQLSGNIPTALADPDFLRTVVPAEMFSVITEGRIDKLMPPFGSGTDNVDPLPTAQRWDIIGYIYILHLE